MIVRFLGKSSASRMIASRMIITPGAHICPQLKQIFNMNTTVQAAKAVGAGFATVALAGVGIGVGIVFASLMSSFARNPSLKGQLFSYAILGFALTEAIALFALMMAFLILFA